VGRLSLSALAAASTQTDAQPVANAAGGRRLGSYLSVLPASSPDFSAAAPLERLP
jgi:hypothetical protein